MRTKVLLDEDSAAAILKLRRDRGIGVSEAIKELIRRSLDTASPDDLFLQRSWDLGVMDDVSSASGAIEALEGPSAR